MSPPNVLGIGPRSPWASLSAPAAYPDSSDFWESVNFTDYSQHSQMVMAPTLRCPLKLEASLCQRKGWHTLCEDLPNATARESEGVRQTSPGPGWAELGPGALLLNSLLPTVVHLGTGGLAPPALLQGTSVGSRGSGGLCMVPGAC